MFEAFEHSNFEFVSDLDIRISDLWTSLKRLAGRTYEVLNEQSWWLKRESVNGPYFNSSSTPMLSQGT
jgi:hypothetical protein